MFLITVMQTKRWRDTLRKVDLKTALPGSHRPARLTLADGSVSEYWYAWKGGPRILKANAKSDALLEQQIAKLLPAALIAYENAKQRPKDNAFLYSLITHYRESAEISRLAPRTKKDRRKHLDVVRHKLGNMELKALQAGEARSVLLKWRDNYNSMPKTADELLGSLSTVLSWAHDRGEISVNPVKGFRRLYRANRAEVIWKPEHLDLVIRHSRKESQIL